MPSRLSSIPPRPDTADDMGKTRHVRLSNDLVDMISWLAHIEGGSAAQIIDPLVRQAITARYEGIRPLVEGIIRAKEEKSKRSLQATHDLLKKQQEESDRKSKRRKR